MEKKKKKKKKGSSLVQGMQMPVPLNSLKRMAMAEVSICTCLCTSFSHIPVLSLLHPLPFSCTPTLSYHLTGGHPLKFPGSILFLCVLPVDSFSPILFKCPNHFSVLCFTASTAPQLIPSPLLAIPNPPYTQLIPYKPYQTLCIRSHYFHPPFCSLHSHL